VADNTKGGTCEQQCVTADKQKPAPFHLKEKARFNKKAKRAPNKLCGRNALAVAKYAGFLQKKNKKNKVVVTIGLC